MHGVSDSLAGRIGSLELEGLSHSEARAAILDLDAVDFALRGAFPELWSNRSVPFCAAASSAA